MRVTKPKTRAWRIELCRNPNADREPQWKTYGLSRYGTWSRAYLAAWLDTRLKRWAARGARVRVFAHGEPAREVFE